MTHMNTSNPALQLSQERKYQVIQTQDQSYTLLTDSEEHMHAKEGAFSETIHVYGEALSLGLKIKNPTVLSLGLGLGYNEILAVTLSLKFLNPIRLISYEQDEYLSQQFMLWIQNQNCDFKVIYDDILSRSSECFQMNKQHLYDQIQQFFLSEAFCLRGTLESPILSEKAHIILYDAFSSKKNPFLWSEDFLNHFFENSIYETCVFATYASRTSLKRVLNKQGFINLNKTGFGFKKENTLALRNLIN